MSKTVPSPTLWFANGVFRTLPLWGAGVFLAVWFLMELILGGLTAQQGLATDTSAYHLGVTFSSLVIAYLIGALIVNRATMEERVKAKYEDIMNHLTLDKRGNITIGKEVSGMFSPNELKRLGALKHLDLLELTQIPNETKIVELEAIRASLSSETNPIDLAEVHARLAKKLVKLGRASEAKTLCEEFLDVHDDITPHARAIVLAQYGRVLKNLGDLDGAIQHLEDASSNIPRDDLFRWMATKKHVLRARFRRDNSIPDQSELYEIHDAILVLIKSNDGSQTAVHTWRINAALESYYDLTSLFMASNGDATWAARYSYAATVLAEVRTGNQHGTYSLTHLTRLLVDSAEFNAANGFLAMIEEGENDLSEKATLLYNRARCHFGLGQFNDAEQIYRDIIDSEAAPTHTRMQAHVGLSHVLNHRGKDIEAVAMMHEAKKISASSGFRLDENPPLMAPVTEELQTIDHAHLPDVDKFGLDQE